MSFNYEYPRPAVTVDALVLSLNSKGLQVVLIERGHEPFQGYWALPGGFVDQDESLEKAVRRELQEETRLVAREILQIGAYGEMGRDPRGHTVGVAYLTALPFAELESQMKAGDDAKNARVFAVDELPALAFDHDRMVADALRRLSSEAQMRQLVAATLGPEALHYFST